MLRFWRSRSAHDRRIFASGPSTPQFQLQIVVVSVAILFEVRFVVLVRRRHQVVQREAIMAVTKLMLASGLRPLLRNRSLEPAKRSANSPRMPRIAAPEARAWRRDRDRSIPPSRSEIA